MTQGYPTYFEPREFYCKCKGEFCEGPSPNPASTRHLAWVAQRIRQEVRAPITVNSGYRCPAWNKKVGGSAHSFHVQGMAADIACSTVSAEDLADIVEKLIENGDIPNGGLGRYSTFVHYDIRETAARWMN